MPENGSTDCWFACGYLLAGSAKKMFVSIPTTRNAKSFPKDSLEAILRGVEVWGCNEIHPDFLCYTKWCVQTDLTVSDPHISKWLPLTLGVDGFPFSTKTLFSACLAMGSFEGGDFAFFLPFQPKWPAEAIQSAGLACHLWLLKKVDGRIKFYMMYDMITDV